MKKIYRYGANISNAFSPKSKLQKQELVRPSNTMKIKAQIKRFIKPIVRKVFQLLKPFLRPVFTRVRSYLLAPAQQEIASIDARLRRAEKAQMAMSKLEASFKQLESQVAFYATQVSTDFDREGNPAADTESGDTYISNGLINAESYLESAMDREPIHFEALKKEYGADAWYYLFEKLFRGSEEEIANRQRVYIKYLIETYAQLQNKPGYFLDFGSGRGEFLGLLKEAKLPAKGVDMSKFNVERLAEKELEVICANGIDFLSHLEDESLYGITQFQVAEHLQYEDLKKFVELASKKIMPGGLLIIETVNPSCVTAMQYFYLDPTHLRPYPPELIRFDAEWYGFEKAKFLFYSPVLRKGSKKDETNYVGYALIAHKKSMPVIDVNVDITQNE